MTPTFQIQILADGTIAYARGEWTRLQSYLCIAGLVGADAELVIRPAKPVRSLPQNAYWHAVVFPLIADHCGYTIEEVKLVLMGECWGWHEVGGHQLPIKPSTSALTLEEGTYFTDWVIPWAMKHLEIAIPLPHEGDAVT